MRTATIASVGILFCLTLCGCSKLATPKDHDAVGTYKATFGWGDAALTLNADHTFLETVKTAEAIKNGSGTWHLQAPDFGGDNLRFDGNFLVVNSKTQGRASPYVATYIQALFGDVTIVNDPDKSEDSFNKQKLKRS
jgi:hypothetical protein